MIGQINPQEAEQINRDLLTWGHLAPGLLVAVVMAAILFFGAWWWWRIIDQAQQAARGERKGK